MKMPQAWASAKQKIHNKITSLENKRILGNMWQLASILTFSNS